LGLLVANDFAAPRANRRAAQQTSASGATQSNFSAKKL
jgi:hypothetical protein